MFDKDGLAISANKLCRKCVRSCRQSESVLLLDCPRFVRRPFKVEDASFTQLDLFGDRPVPPDKPSSKDHS
jgi:hypothetical protein